MNIRPLLTDFFVITCLFFLKIPNIEMNITRLKIIQFSWKKDPHVQQNMQISKMKDKYVHHT